jgi:signal transduction histidine kinase
LFLIGLFWFYRAIIVKDLEGEYNSFREHLYTVSEQVVQNMNNFYPDRQRIERYIKSIAKDEGIRIQIYSVEGDRVYFADGRLETDVSVELKTFTVTAEDAVYILEFAYPLSMKSFHEIKLIRRVRDFSLIFLSGSFIVLIFIFHRSLVRPLTTLHRSLESVSYRNARINLPVTQKDEIGEVCRKFEDMLRRLDDARLQQDEMVAAISHDLKTPLTSICGYVERLLSGKVQDGERRREYLEIIYQKAMDMSRLLVEFNDYVSSGLGTDDINKEYVNLKDFFEALCHEYSIELESIGAALQSEVSVPANVYINIDLSKIRRVFANLVENSIKYVKKPVVIRMSCILQKNNAVFRIEDNGDGVLGENLDLIFEKFYRMDRSRSSNKGGSGLGLAICRNIIMSHEGSIRAYAAEGGGLGVEVTLPTALNPSKNGMVS